MLSIYTASKLDKADLWKKLDKTWHTVHITSRWPFEHVGKIPDSAGFAAVFWEHDLADVEAADIILVYAEEGDKLRGALVEAGMAIALGKRVIVVGEHPDYGTWQFHSQVLRAANLEEAKTLIDMLQLPMRDQEI